MAETNEFINRIIHGDCIEIMKQIPDGTVDMCFADPPFNLKKKYGNWKDEKNAEEYVEWCERWLDEMKRVLKPSGTLFVHNIPKWLPYYAVHLNKKGMIFRHWIAWEAMSVPLGKTLLPAHYGILYYTKSKKGFKFYDLRRPHERCRKCGEFAKDYGGKKYMMHPFGTLLGDVWTDIHRIRHAKRRDNHPCQLPEPLLERLILMSTDEGDLILDPFIGAGTTALSAKRLKRNFIGIDNDRKYVEITLRKLKEIKPFSNNGYVYSCNGNSHNKNNNHWKNHTVRDDELKEKTKNEKPEKQKKLIEIL